MSVFTVAAAAASRLEALAARTADPANRAVLEEIAGQLHQLADEVDRNEGRAPDTKSRETTAYRVPGPYDIALAFGPALLASGKYETAEAAMAAAWFAVPAFYAGRDAYLRELVPVLYGPGGPGAPADDGTQFGAAAAA